MIVVYWLGQTRVTGWNWRVVFERLRRAQYEAYTTAESFMDALADRARVWSGAKVRTDEGLTTFFNDLVVSGLLELEHNTKEAEPIPVRLPVQFYKASNHACFSQIGE